MTGRIIFMDENKWFEQLEKWAEEFGVSVESLIEESAKMEAKGEIGLSYLKKHLTSKVDTQEDARTLFRMAAQEADLSSTDEYIEVFPNLGKIEEHCARRDFRATQISTDRLQQRNIMLSPELWHTIVENTKTPLTDRILRKSVDRSKGQILFSQIFKLSNLETLDNTIAHRKDCDALILRTIQMDFLNTSENYEKKRIKTFKKEDMRKYSREFDAFIEAADGRLFNDIYKIADCCLDFSIHEYYLPFGLSTEGLRKAVLLMRYDHCSDKHKNSALPKHYSLVYDAALSEPHFHFNEGFGQIYKLLTRNGQGNFGAGFAIGLPSLNAYLNKLQTLKDMPAATKKLWLQNDFGMPFLAIAKQERKPMGTYITPEEQKEASVIAEMAQVTRDLYIANFIGEQSFELQRAVDMFDIINGTENSNASLSQMEIFSDYDRNPDNNNTDDNSRNRK